MIRMIVCIPKFGCDVKIFPCDYAFINGSAYTSTSDLFVSIVASGVKATVSCLDGIVHSFFRVVKAVEMGISAMKNISNSGGDEMSKSVKAHSSNHLRIS